MGEKSADEKIELLVRSVLEAVDARLAEVRHEMHQLGADVDRRHQEVLQRVEDIERRLELRSGEAIGPAAGADGLAIRMEQATQVLLERIEAMHQRNTIATNERFALIDAAVEQLGSRAAASSVASDPTAPDSVPSTSTSTSTSTTPATSTSTSTATAVMPRPGAMNAPFRMAPVTTEHPVMATLPPLQDASVADPPAGVPEDHIDLDQLADLLTERLGQMSLSPRPL